MKNRTDLYFGDAFCLQLSIIYLILDLIYWMVTIFIFDKARYKKRQISRDEVKDSTLLINRFPTYDP